MNIIMLCINKEDELMHGILQHTGRINQWDAQTKVHIILVNT